MCFVAYSPLTECVGFLYSFNMPTRADIFFNGGFYHIYNKNIEPLAIFNDDNLCNEFVDTFVYYRSARSHPRYSFFKKMEDEIKIEKLKEILYPSSFIVDILSFTLMPNHYHFLLKQLKSDGIINFMSNIINSITRFSNIKTKRKGPVFLPQFRSRRILTVETLVYVSRYIYTNVYAAGVVKSKEEIFSYSYSSINSYLKDDNPLKINIKPVLEYFNHDKKRYKNFILDNAEGQKMREIVKYTNRWR